jgi:hypothetical protein
MGTVNGFHKLLSTEWDENEIKGGMEIPSIVGTLNVTCF